MNRFLNARLSGRFLAFFISALVFVMFKPDLGLSSEKDEISVLAYNIWGVISAKYRNARIEKIPEAVMELNPDIICLIEAFRPRDHKALRQGFEDLGYPVKTWRHQDCGYGTGVLVISRFETLETDYEKFKAEGDLCSYERLACRGLLRVVFDTPAGPLEFYATHSIPRMKLIFTEDMEVIEGDPKELYRYLQMYELSAMFQQRRAAGSRSIVAAGDFNVSPEMREYELLLRLSGLANSFDDMNCGENPSTYCTKTNEFATIEGSRIDHMFYQNYEGDSGYYLKPVKSCRVMTEKYDTLKGEMHLSDHYGIFTVFDIAAEDQVERSAPPVLNPPLSSREFYSEGVTGDKIEFDESEREAWDVLALEILKSADKKFKPPSPAVKAAARILTAKQASGTVTISIEPRETKALTRFIEKLD